MASNFYRVSIMGTYLGQNFLTDVKVRQYIADHIFTLYKDLGCEALIEIGPGKGSITKLIHHISQNFFVIEKDTTLKAGLLEILNSKCGILNGLVDANYISADVLDVDVEKILKEKKLKSEKTLVVGNLPYYITSPILRKFFGEGKQGPEAIGASFAGGIFMVQDEVALRLVSDVHKKSYLRRLLNHSYDVKYLKGVPAKCFKPAPKVKSALIQLSRKSEVAHVSFEKLIAFLDLYSAFTRKTLGAIATMLTKKGTNVFVIPEHLRKKRMEELSWEEMEEVLR